MRIAAISLLLFAAGCSQKPEISTIEYKIAEDGSPDTRNQNTYASLGDKTFNRVQKYRITAQGEAGKQLHYIIVKISKTVGKKKVDTVEAASIPVVDGIADFECDHYYDVKISQNVDALDDPVCKIEPRGILFPNGVAKISK